MAADFYKTLRSPGSDTFILRKSRFIGAASPVQTERQALDFLDKIRQQFRDASHHCFAYVIGRNSGTMRYSDDGEPGGTAGMPILEVIRARGLVDCVVVVTRYFGGVLLGAGGLTRAYAQGSAVALKAAGVVVMQASTRYWVEIAYPLWDRVAYYLDNAPLLREQTDFSSTVTATLLLRDADAAQVFETLTALTDGRIERLPIDTLFYPWPETP